MKLEKHVFISYAHIDNKTTPDDSRGWVTRFHDYLAAYLSSSLGEEAHIWRDDRLRGTDVFENEIIGQFPQTAVLVCILSPRYLESDWCIREVDAFCNVASEIGGLVVDNQARVIRIELRPVPAEQRERLPKVLRGVLGYEFYQRAEGQRILPLDPSFGNAEAYKRNIYFLADDAAELIRKLRQKLAAATAGPSAPRSIPSGARPPLYLAECGYDRSDVREKIRGELRAHGYTILPDQQLPDVQSAYIAEVRRLLEQCPLSIHLLGAGGGKTPDSPGPSKKSAVSLQNEIATAMSKERGLRRLLWLPQGTVSDDPDQKDLIDAVVKVDAMQYGADLITGDLEALKRAIFALLKSIEEPKLTDAAKADVGSRIVSLICVESDLPSTVPLRKYLKEKGLAVRTPLFVGDAAKLRQDTENQLRTCHGVLVYYGAGDEEWIRTVEDDLIRARGYRDGRLAVSFTYIGPPPSPSKLDRIAMADETVIDGLTAFNEAGLQRFVDAVNRG